MTTISPEDPVFAEADELADVIRAAERDFDLIVAPMHDLMGADVDDLRRALQQISTNAESLTLELEVSILASKATRW